MINSHEGWLHLKTARVESWERRWVTFDDGILSYSATQLHSVDSDMDFNEGVTRVPMDQVISLRIDVRYQIVTQVLID